MLTLGGVGDTIPMKNLRVGDVVLAVEERRDGSFDIIETEVIVFLDRKPNAEGVNYIHLSARTTDGESMEINMTPNHLLFVLPRDPDCALVPCEPVSMHAGAIQAGAIIFVRTIASDGKSKIVSATVEKVAYQKHTGAYAPLTKSGTILVDNVVVSSYALGDAANKITHSAAHAAFSPVRVLYELGRVAGTVLPTWHEGKIPSYQDGVHWYAEALTSLYPAAVSLGFLS